MNQPFTITEPLNVQYIVDAIDEDAARMIADAWCTGWATGDFCMKLLVELQFIPCSIFDAFHERKEPTK